MSNAPDDHNLSTNVPGSAWFDRALMIEVYFACAVALTANGADPDLWGHVQYGRDALREGLARTCTYSYAVDDFRWINHENLAEYAFAWVTDTFGPIGLLCGKCAMGLIIIGLLARRLRQEQVGLVGRSAVLLLVAVSLSYYWQVRPQIFTYFFFALIIALLSYAFEGWAGAWHLPAWRSRPDRAAGPDAAEPESHLAYSPQHLRWLWAAPPLIVLATNAHGGFLAIFCVLAAYLGLRSCEALYRLGRRAWPLVLQFTGVVLASGAATLVNPYGYKLHTWLYMDLSIPRPEILEWHRPDFTSSHTMPLVLLMIAGIACLLFSRRRHDATQLFVLGCCLWQSLEHLRHLPFFAIPFGFWYATHVESVLRYFNVSRPGMAFGQDMSHTVRRCFVMGIACASLLIGWKLAPRLTTLTVKCDEYPVAAFRYIAERGFHGKMICTFNWAQYALAAFGTSTSVNSDSVTSGGPSPSSPNQGLQIHSDGRLRTSYPQEILDMHFDFILGDLPGMRQRSPQSPPCDGRRILEFRSPDLILLDRGQAPAQDALRQEEGKWVLLYQDGLAQLWGRAAKYDDPASPDYLAPELRRISDAPQSGTVPWPAIPSPPLRSTEPSNRKAHP